jgi:hypothetical protein
MILSAAAGPSNNLKSAMYEQVLRTYLARFRWEILLYWVISLARILAIREGHLYFSELFSLIGFTSVVWLGLRMMLAEEMFHLQGGWRTRPIPWQAQAILPGLLFFLILAIPCILQIFVVQQIFHLSFQDASSEIWKRTIFWFIVWVLFCVALRCIGSLLLAPQNLVKRQKIWTGLTLITVFIVLLQTIDRLNTNRAYDQAASNKYGASGMGISIIQELPDATDFLGDWSEQTSSCKVRLIEKMSLVDSPQTSVPGVHALDSEISSINGETQVVLRCLCLDRNWSMKLLNAVPVLRYSNGAYALSTESATDVKSIDGYQIWTFRAAFASPARLPGFTGKPEDLLHGLELSFYERLESNSSRELIKLPPPQTVDQLFKQFPWSDDTWNEIARPLLSRKATEADRGRILKFVQYDTRLLWIAREKGWERDCIPALRKLLHDRMFIEVIGIELLVAEQDPTLADDLKAVALQHRYWNQERLATILRLQPGFDWRGYALEAWKRQKYSNYWINPAGEYWRIALWAAQEGDATAFFRTAEDAAQGKDWQIKQLATLVDTDDKDIVSYVRNHMKEMQYDAGKKRWFAASAVKSP